MTYKLSGLRETDRQGKARSLVSKFIAPVTSATLMLGFLPVAQADYLGSSNLRIFPTPIADSLSDGYDVGDQIEFIIEITPSNTGSVKGHAAWSTFYVPPGAKVVDTFYATKNGPGDFSQTIAEVVDETYDGCKDGDGNAGGRGCGKNYQAAINPVDLEGVYFANGRTNEVQQDTGIFYSTDPRTAQIFTLGDVDPTGVPANKPFNVWDRDQVLSMGIGAGTSGNKGQGNTPIISTDATGVTDNTATWHGIGSPVAGPGTYYTNDYNPTLTPGATMTCPDGSNIVTNGDGTRDEFEEYQCVGPWQRIEIPGDEFGGSTTRPGDQLGRNIDTDASSTTIIRTSTDFSGGYNFANQGPLPDTVNAVRIVHGERKLGDLEHWGLVLEITDVDDFIAALTPDDSRVVSAGTCLDTGSPVNGDTNCDGEFNFKDTLICAESVPGDTSDTAAKDNNWRYYEVSRSCVDLSPDAVLVKEIATVDGESNATVAADGDVIVYTFTFVNIDDNDLNLNETLTDVYAFDVGGDGIDLLEPGAGGCPAAPIPTNGASSYDGVSTVDNSEIVPNKEVHLYDSLSITNDSMATWTNRDATSGAGTMSLPEGNSITYTVCGVVDEDDALCGSGGETCTAENEVRVHWANCAFEIDPNGDPTTHLDDDGDEYCLSSRAIIPISNSISGFVIDETGIDIDGILDVGETGIEGVIIRLYDDDGNGVFDGGENLVATAVTNASGFYEFVGIPADTYIIVEVQPAGFTSSGDVDETGGGTAHCPGAINDCDTIGGGASNPGVGAGGDGDIEPITVAADSKITRQDFFEFIDGPDLSVVKTDSVALFAIKNEQYSYTLTVTNNGTTNATNVIVNDTWPADKLNWVSTQNSTDPSPGDFCTTDNVEDCNCTDPDGADSGTNTIQCELGTLAPTQSETITITVTVK